MKLKRRRLQNRLQTPPSLHLLTISAATFIDIRRDIRYRQFLKEWIGAGIRPFRLINCSQLNLLTGMIGA